MGRAAKRKRRIFKVVFLVHLPLNMSIIFIGGAAAAAVAFEDPDDLVTAAVLLKPLT